ncbi:uracil-DNA glycosylase [Brevundimonas sp. 2R-24]|uniref:Type-4 uracil-DNA glycosylase n=1 Tax=Peiella sedimenti TaxID=3061083 RepID=A0ABT8SJ00_9CAUL|nr:uracil-DNA glycosylase [Caulobacteraceae bacterium XZ-24]
MLAASAHDRALESLLAFWRDAGVDACLEEAPVDRRLQAPQPKAVVAALRAAAAAGTGAGDERIDLSHAVALAREAAQAAETLEQLKEAVAAFDGCALKRSGARQAVFSRGRPDAPLLVIGEAPGADEDARGEPFVGRAGKLLDRMLEAAGLLDKALITNTVYWRPPGNATPSPGDQAICAPFVERTAQLVRPKAVLLVGAAAARSVLKTTDGILKVRGNWGSWRIDGELELPVMPTLHPAFLLRQPAAKGRAWSDILTLAARLGAGGPGE